MKLENCLAQGKTYIIAEMSGNHDGSLDKALAIVRAAAAAGADCLKIQTYTADTLTIDSHTPPFLLGKGLWENEYLYDLYKKAYTPWEWTGPIMEACRQEGLDFLSTPFDFTAVDFLEEAGIECYKIASFELIDIPLIRKTALTGKPMIVSCGMGSEEEIAEAVRTIREAGNENFVLLKCCSAYPSDPDTMHLKTIPDMRERFGVPIGLSDHSEGSLAAVIAVSLGAQVIEKHMCLTSEDKTVDSAFSLSAEEFAQLVRDIRTAERALGSVSYGPSPEEAESLRIRRSLFAVADIRKGEPFTAENVRSIRPADGLHTRYYDVLLSGRTAARDIPFGTPLSEEDVAEGL